jgi:hypothetical protein
MADTAEELTCMMSHPPRFVSVSSEGRNARSNVKLKLRLLFSHNGQNHFCFCHMTSHVCL